MNYISKKLFSPDRFSTEAMYENSQYLRKSFYKRTVNNGLLDELHEVDKGGKPIGQTLSTALGVENKKSSGSSSAVHTIRVGKQAATIKKQPKSFIDNMKTTLTPSRRTKDILFVAGVSIGCIFVARICIHYLKED